MLLQLYADVIYGCGNHVIKRLRVVETKSGSLLNAQHKIEILKMDVYICTQVQRVLA